MNRKSFECTEIVLEYIMETEDIYRSLDCEELTSLIQCSPSNLLEFFKDSLKIQDREVPSFGLLKIEPVSFATTDNSNIG